MEPERVLCCNVLNTEHAHQDSIFRHSLFAFEEALPWPPANWRELRCWHCVHSCPSEPICLPNSYDRRRDVFHVFGLFCSLQCAKAYLVEHSAFGSGDRALLLHQLAVRCFGHVGGPVQPAPPRHRLSIFGGDLDIEAFRSEHTHLSIVLSPPLISTPEVYERCADRDAAPELWARAPRPPSSSSSAPPAGGGLFNAFVKQKRAAPEPAPREDIPGTLCVYLKARKKA